MVCVHVKTKHSKAAFRHRGMPAIACIQPSSAQAPNARSQGRVSHSVHPTIQAPSTPAGACQPLPAPNQLAIQSIHGGVSAIQCVQPFTHSVHICRVVSAIQRICKDVPLATNLVIQVTDKACQLFSTFSHSGGVNYSVLPAIFSHAAHGLVSQSVHAGISAMPYCGSAGVCPVLYICNTNWHAFKQAA
eukprot:1162115-Pelagomonas_calceolata.AAC.17